MTRGRCEDHQEIINKIEDRIKVVEEKQDRAFKKIGEIRAEFVHRDDCWKVSQDIKSRVNGFKNGGGDRYLEIIKISLIIIGALVGAAFGVRL